MATARKLPSGAWRVRVYDYTDASGVKHYRSFTSKIGKKDAEKMALAWQSTRSHEKMEISLGEAAIAYIEERRTVLSPSTVKGYATHARQIAPIAHIQLDRLTQGDIQSFISDFSKAHSPKTVSNVHGFISAVLARYRPDFNLSTKLPQKVPDTIYIPSQKDIDLILSGSKNDPDLHRAILLATYGPMRRSEICAASSGDLKGGVLHVHSAMVEGDDGQWHIKLPKTTAGDRFISLPGTVVEALEGVSGQLVDINPHVLSRRFLKLLKKTGAHHMRFHSLRHYCASQLHALGMPDAYIMERGGWESDSVLKGIYRHTLADYAEEENNRVNKRLDDLISKNV